MNRLDELHKQFYGDFIVNDSADPETMIARTEGWANRVYDLEQENATLKAELQSVKKANETLDAYFDQCGAENNKLMETLWQSPEAVVNPSLEWCNQYAKWRDKALAGEAGENE